MIPLALDGSIAELTRRELLGQHIRIPTRHFRRLGLFGGKCFRSEGYECKQRDAENQRPEHGITLLLLEWTSASFAARATSYSMLNKESNPYAAPQADLDGIPPVVSDTNEVWRDGSLLVVRNGTTLPRRCAFCNSPTEHSSDDFRQRWHPPWVFWLILVPPVGLVASLILTKTAYVRYGVCRKHRRRRWFSFVAFLILVIVLPIISFAFSGALGLLLPATLVVASLCALSVFSLVKSLSIKHMHGEMVWIKGASPAFLDDLPQLPSAIE
jgi:nitrate reductase NapE component